MRIWHLEAGGDPSAVDGTTTGLWSLAAAQAQLGADVTLALHEPPTAAGRARAAEVGIELREIPRSWRTVRVLSGVPAADLPDIVNLHGSWVPSHVAVARHLKRRGMPYVVTAHGGHTEWLVAVGRLKRKVYLRVAERGMIEKAAAVVYATRAEAEDAEAMFGHPLPHARYVAFPCGVDRAEKNWTPDESAVPSIVYLGRFDVYHKAIDDVCALARALPDVPFDLYGSPPEWTDARATFDKVAASAPANLTFHDPVYGEDKKAALAAGTLYLQYSRFEGFPLALTEALAQGVPAACADRLAVTRELVAHDAAIALPSDPQVAAPIIADVLADRTRLDSLSASGLAYVGHRVDLEAMANDYLEVYRDVLSAVPDRR